MGYRMAKGSHPKRKAQLASAAFDKENYGNGMEDTGPMAGD